MNEEGCQALTRLVYLHWSEQKERWGSEGKSGLNVLRVTGLQVDAESKPLPVTLESDGR